MSSAVATLGKRHADGCWTPSGLTSVAPAAAAPSLFASAACSAAVAPGSSSESPFSSRQKRPRACRSNSVAFSPFSRRLASAITSVVTECARAASAEPSLDALSSTSVSVSKSTAARSRAIASRQ